MKNFWNQGDDIVLLIASISGGSLLFGLLGLCGMPVNPNQIKNAILGGSLGVCGICLYWFFEKK